MNFFKLWKRIFIRDQAPYREHTHIDLFIGLSAGPSICLYSLHRVVHNVIYKTAENSTCKFRYPNTNDGCRIRLHHVYQPFWLSMYVLLSVFWFYFLSDPVVSQFARPLIFMVQSLRLILALSCQQVKELRKGREK